MVPGKKTHRPAWLMISSLALTVCASFLPISLVLLCGGGHLTSNSAVLVDGVALGDVSVAAMSISIHGDDDPAMQ